jgi:glycine cleavage system H protein
VSEGTSVPDDRRYTSEHEWAKQEGDLARVGITDYAQHELGDVVYVELPKVGAKVSAMGQFGVIESVKSASDLFSPVSGEVVEVNAALADESQLVNDSPYDQGWMLLVRLENPSEYDGLMTPEQYRALIVG